MRSASALWVLTRRLNCSVRRSISILSLTRPFQSWAIRREDEFAFVGCAPLEEGDGGQAAEKKKCLLRSLGTSPMHYALTITHEIQTRVVATLPYELRSTATIRGIYARC